MTTLKGRLKHLRTQVFKKTQSEIADMLGITLSRFRNLEIGITKNIPIEDVTRFEVALKVNPWWLISGRGKMMLGDTTDYFTNTIVFNEDFRVQRIDEENSWITIGKALLSSHHTNLEERNIRAFRLVGDSMHPTLASGDYVLLNTRFERNNNGLYVIKLGKDLQLVRLTYFQNKTVTISFDNVAYKEQIITEKQRLIIVGAVFLMIKNC